MGLEKNTIMPSDRRVQGVRPISNVLKMLLKPGGLKSSRTKKRLMAGSSIFLCIKDFEISDKVKE